MNDDDGVTRRNMLGALGAAGVAVVGAGAGNYVAENQHEINRKGAEANYIGKNTDTEGIGIRNIDVDFYPQQKSGRSEASGLERVSKALDGIGNDLPVNRILEQGRVLADVNPAPVDGGGQYQGNAASTGYTETNKDPVTGFGEPELVDTGNFGSPPVSLGGRTAIAGSGSMDVYDQSGNRIASFEDEGTESVPVLLSNGSEIIGADASGLFKYDVDTGDQLASVEAPKTGSQGSLKISNGTVAVESDGRADFFDASDLSPISSVSNAGPGFRTLAFADSENAIYADGESVETVNPQDGTKNWSVDPFGSRLASEGGATNGDEYAATTTDGRVLIFDKEDGDKVADLNIGSEKSVSSPVFDANGSLYTLTDRFTKFNSDYEQIWSTPANGLGNITVGADNVLMASTTNAIQMLDTQSGEVVDEALSNGKAKSTGMPRNGKLPVIEFDTGNYYELPLERGESDPAQSPSIYIADFRLQAPEDTVPVGETAQLNLDVAIEDNAPFPVRLTYELVVRHEGEQGILKDTAIGQPGETTTEEYPVTTESSEQDAVTTNGTAIDWDVKFEDDSTPGNETARANATATNSTFSN